MIILVITIIVIKMLMIICCAKAGILIFLILILMIFCAYNLIEFIGTGMILFMFIPFYLLIIFNSLKIHGIRTQNPIYVDFIICFKEALLDSFNGGVFIICILLSLLYSLLWIFLLGVVVMLAVSFLWIFYTGFIILL